MEKAVLKTLAYADIFAYPMKVWEVHKWLLEKKASLRDVEKTLNNLSQEGKIKNQDGYYSLAGRKGLIRKRVERSAISKRYFARARLISQFFKLIPTVLLVGVSGGLAMENASSKDDIDLFVITDEGKLWQTRFLLLCILQALGKRRKKSDSKQAARGKCCLNILIDENNLAQNGKDIYTAHEVLQLKVLWEKGDVYSKFLAANSWVFKFLPNWRGVSVQGRMPKAKSEKQKTQGIAERLARALQLSIMGATGKSRWANDNVLCFHPENYREKILAEYTKAVKDIGTPLTVLLTFVISLLR